MTHQVLSILLLSSLHHHSFLRSRLHVIRVIVLSHVHLCVSVEIPVNLELSHAGLFSKDVSSKAGNINLGWRIIVHFLVVILNVDIVSNTHELLSVVVRTSQKDGSNSNNITFRHGLRIYRVLRLKKIHIS